MSAQSSVLIPIVTTLMGTTGMLMSKIAHDSELDTDCACNGFGIVFVEGPCDAAPLEAPCKCLAEQKQTEAE